MSRRDDENAARQAHKRKTGKPLVSRYAAKGAPYAYERASQAHDDKPPLRGRWR